MGDRDGIFRRDTSVYHVRRRRSRNMRVFRVSVGRPVFSQGLICERAHLGVNTCSIRLCVQSTHSWRECCDSVLPLKLYHGRSYCGRTQRGWQSVILLHTRCTVSSVIGASTNANTRGTMSNIGTINVAELALVHVASPNTGGSSSLPSAHGACVVSASPT